MTAGTIGLLLLCGFVYKLRQIHLKSKCSKILDLEVDVESLAK